MFLGNLEHNRRVTNSLAPKRSQADMDKQTKIENLHRRDLVAKRPGERSHESGRADKSACHVASLGRAGFVSEINRHDMHILLSLWPQFSKGLNFSHTS